ncbi:unnamed protein product [Tuber aestivum]|uniref:Uncharacterized protein n=1 Tax=Tuber aestivum TaxID=59557 RepID=A0A292Q333_9PEZI|nr:unnamed protein product [Tuber aestivum]
MFKCGFSAAGPQQQRSLLPGDERPNQEHAWNILKRATAVQATQESKTPMFRTKELQPRSNHSSSNRPLARPMDSQSRSGVKLKLSSIMTGRGRANDPGRRGTRTRPADAVPGCPTSAINKQKFGRGRGSTGRGDKASPGLEKKSRKAKMHTDGIRKRRTPKTAKKRRESLAQHPLARSFTDSLDHATTHLSESLPRALSDKLETLLCRTAATTSLSETYLSHSSGLKNALFCSSPLLSGSLERKADRLKGLTHEEFEKLGVLWGKWKQCVGEIQRLATDEATFAERREEMGYGSEKGDDNASGMVNNDEYWGELECAALAERIESVGEVWLEKMEECEKVRILPIFSLHPALYWSQKYHTFFTPRSVSLLTLPRFLPVLKKIADEELRQRRLAATVLL